MNTYEPGCSSFHTPESRSWCHVPVPAPVTIAQLMPASSIASRVSRASSAAAAIAAARCLGLAQVLRGAVVRVQAAKAQSRRFGDPLRQRHRGRAGRDAAAVRADVDLDVDVEGHCGLRRRVRKREHIGGIVDQHADRRTACEVGEARDLGRRDDLVGDEHVGNACVDERRGFVGLLAADSDRAGGDLQPRDLGAFVRLGVRAQPDAVRRIRQAIDVAREGVEIEDERGRVDRGERVAGAGGRVLRHGRGQGNKFPRYFTSSRRDQGGCPTAGRPDACVGYLPCTDAASAAASWPYTRRPIASICARSIWPDSAYAQFSSTQ